MRRKISIRIWLTALCCSSLLAAPSLWAMDLYSVVGVQQHRIEVNQSSFDTVAVAGRAGVWIAPGIGLEIGGSLPFTDYSVGSVTVEMDYLLSAGIRLEGPLRTGGWAAYFLGGLATAGINGRSNLTADSAEGRYDGSFFGLGMVHSLGLESRLTLEFTHYAVDSEIAIPGFQLGFRRSF